MNMKTILVYHIALKVINHLFETLNVSLYLIVPLKTFIIKQSE